ncbi:MAG: indole-3-glycerol phosphate synthase TrpC [bacterium]|nr:indole-3-glycerol phosphate synthase TrpC [bacterium]
MAESVLDRIVAAVRRRQLETRPGADLARAAVEAAELRRRGGLRSLKQALSAPGASIIAECKRASPSAGLIREDFDPIALARSYEAGGASAISVVTEPDFFKGNPVWVRHVRDSVSLPVLRKDFIISVRQVYETALLGADAFLLIQRILTPEMMRELLVAARNLHLEVLLEIFVDEDPAESIKSGAQILGVNARNLATFETRLDKVVDIAEQLPDDRVRVAESGIHSRDDVVMLQDAGYGAFLIGEHLVRSEDASATIRELRGE